MKEPVEVRVMFYVMVVAILAVLGLGGWAVVAVVNWIVSQ